MQAPDAAAVSRSPRAVVQLPAKLANQIAAGEVVARPASVVKELCENAVDAGATRIRVEIEGGGIELVRVIDDGHGMAEPDARLAMRRHATSKLRRVEDLQAIDTLGFRGEALPSIASVGRFVMRTRTRDAAAGIEISCDGGEAPDVRPSGIAPGTTVELADLFFNVPARRKFLRAPSTESAHVTEVVRELALAHPTVGVELYRDGRQAKRWLPVTTRAERVAATFDGLPLIACEGERGPARVEAHLTRPEKARSGATGLSIFVCGRPVRDRALARAVASAFGEALERGRFPLGALFVDLPLDLVDVNVHPQKAEVRFAEARAVTDAVYSVVSSSVAAALALPLARKTSAIAPKLKAPAGDDEVWTWPSVLDGPAAHAHNLRTHDNPPVSAPFPDGGEQPRRPAEPRPAPTDGASANPSAAPPERRNSTVVHGRRFVAKVGGRFLLFDTGKQLVVVDGRRANEERWINQLTAELGRGQVVAQRLLFPIAVACENADADAVEQHAAALERIGFELRRTGPAHVAAHTLPRRLADGPAEAMIDRVMSALRKATDPPFGLDAPQLFRELARLAAKHLPPPSPADLDPEAIASATVHQFAYDGIA